MLTITIQDLGDVVILQCRGRIVRGEETSILCPAVRHAGRDVILDLKRVDAIDAAGIGALLSLQAAGVYLRLRDPSEAVREVLRLTRLETVFEICRSERTEVILGAIVQENGSEDDREKQDLLPYQPQPACSSKSGSWSRHAHLSEGAHSP